MIDQNLARNEGAELDRILSQSSRSVFSRSLTITMPPPKARSKTKAKSSTVAAKGE